MQSEEERKLKHNIANKERYYWLKEHHICTKCGNKEAFHNYTLCEDCLYKRNEQAHATQAQRTIYQRDRKNRLKAEGKCVACGKKRDGKSIVFCNRCLEVSRRNKRLAKQRKLAETRLSPEELHKLQSENGKRNIIKVRQTEGFRLMMERKKKKIANAIMCHILKKNAEKGS